MTQTNGKPKGERYIFLGMPSYGRQTDKAGQSFWRACHDDTDIRREIANPKQDSTLHVQRSGSLLAASFNFLWATALNVVHQGGRIDYFAMQHDDIGLPDFWLDTLIDELEANHLDVLGVVAPIKDTHGVTSIALQRPDGDTWRVHTRLTMHEIYRLPPTFTAKDVGYPLLLNTGCWVCKFNPEWARQVHFTINDRIVFNRALNMYQAQVESEDWFFSRLCNDLGLKLGCTRKIQLSHRGDTDFLNDHPWGTDRFDGIYVSEPVVPEQAPAGDVFPHDVDGWLLPAEGEALAELARGKRVLEIGSYCGKSTICLAQTAEHVTAVDYFDGRATPEPRDTLAEFKANIEQFGVSGKIEICYPGTAIPLPKYDLAFIDGAHDYESVLTDLYIALKVLKPGGLLAFHDYRKQPGQYDGGWDPGVTAAVNAFIADGAELLSVHNTLAVVRPPAAIPLEV